MIDLKHTSHLYGSNSVFIQELYNQYIKNPDTVDLQWKAYFASLGDNAQVVTEENNGAPWQPYANRIIGVMAQEEVVKKQEKAANANAIEYDLQNSLRAANLINSYRIYGH